MFVLCFGIYARAEEWAAIPRVAVRIFAILIFVCVVIGENITPKPKKHDTYRRTYEDLEERMDELEDDTVIRDAERNEPSLFELMMFMDDDD